MTPNELIIVGIVALVIVVIFVAIVVAKKGKDKKPESPIVNHPNKAGKEDKTPKRPSKGPHMIDDAGREKPSKDPKPEKEAKEVEVEVGDETIVKVSTDMSAKEAIKHIRNTAVENLGNFVTDDEDRVTVQRAWEKKNEKD